MQQDGCSDSTGPDYFIQSMFQEGHMEKEFWDFIQWTLMKHLSKNYYFNCDQVLKLWIKSSQSVLKHWYLFYDTLRSPYGTQP